MPFHGPLLLCPVLLLLVGSSLNTSDPDLLELLCNLPQDSVYTNIGPFVERLLTHGALIQRAGFPVSQDAALAKVVSTRDRYRVSKDVETNGAVHLLFGKVPSGGHSCTAERQGHFQHKKPGSERGIKPAVILRSLQLDGLALFKGDFHANLLAKA